MKLSQRRRGRWNCLPTRRCRYPRLEITGRDDILITGKAVLLEYSPEQIRVARDSCEVTIRGAELRISAMDKMGMQVFGLIASVEFTE